MLCLLFYGVWPDLLYAGLLRGARGAGRRPSEIGQRPGAALVGVGLLYQEGYFAQYLNADGWQQERYPINDFYNMPCSLERQPDGSELAHWD